MASKELLAAVPLFSGCSARELVSIARLASEVSVEAGDVVIEEGTMGDRFYVIDTGSATVTIGGRKIARLGTGDFFGEIALLDALPGTATVTAAATTKLYEIKATDFTGFIEGSPSVLRAILKAVAERLRAAEDAPAYATRH